MKKKVIFMVINMNVGGTEKALLNMISEMPKEKYDITILMLEEYGGFLNAIPSHVHVKYIEGYKNIKGMLNNPPHITSFNLLKKGKIVKALNISFFYVLTKVMHERTFFLKHVLKDSKTLNEEYDVAVAYAGPMDFISYFVLNKIKAKEKIQWIHFDITKIGFNKHFAAKQYSKFDKIFVVSKEAKSKLISLVPIIKQKTDVFLNVISTKDINFKVKEGKGFDDSFKGLRILTVGRLSIEKGQDLGIKACSKLIKDGYDVKWYCIGEGNARNEYERLIEHYNLKNKFILLGANSNPYPFIKQCAIYVQPSRYEGYCITIEEAKCLNKPIVTTEVNGAKEQILNGKTGFIVGFNEDEIYHAVKHLIKNKEIRNTFAENLKRNNKDTLLEVNKICKYI